MVLLVSVCDPVSVATLLSIEIVRAADPSNVVPELSCKPVPTVSALVVTAVIVPDAPRATVVPLNVTELLLSAAFGMFDSVFNDASMVLFVIVCAPVSVTPSVMP